MIFVQAEIIDDKIVLYTSYGIANMFRELCKPFVLTKEEMIENKNEMINILSMEPSFDAEEYSKMYDEEIEERLRTSKIYKEICDSFCEIEDHPMELASEKISFPLSETAEIVAYLSDYTLDVQPILREDKDIYWTGLYSATIIAAIVDACGNRSGLRKSILDKAFPYSPDK